MKELNLGGSSKVSKEELDSFKGKWSDQINKRMADPEFQRKTKEARAAFASSTSTSNNDSIADPSKWGNWVDFDVVRNTEFKPTLRLTSLFELRIGNEYVCKEFSGIFYEKCWGNMDREFALMKAMYEGYESYTPRYRKMAQVKQNYDRFCSAMDSNPDAVREAFFPDVLTEETTRFPCEPGADEKTRKLHWLCDVESKLFCLYPVNRDDAGLPPMKDDDDD